jgi:bisphosphoglycerate-independent phosphoglycerate mutase (AlkP superfamily)
MTTHEPKLNNNNNNNNNSAFPEVLPNVINDGRDHHPISTENYLPRMTTHEPKLNNNSAIISFIVYHH